MANRGHEREHDVTTRASKREHEGAAQFLTFKVAAEEYGVELLAVQEIRAFSAITPLPGAASHVKGVMNLRGVVVPVIGLRERFGLPSVPYDRFTVIVLLHVHGRVVGIIVDAVSDVLDLDTSDIEPTPELGLSDKAFLKGLGKVKDKLVTVLEPGALLADVAASAA
jgi:purine-binding chemotaxis protein CheW